jgi:hypothetical protein
LGAPSNTGDDTMTGPPVAPMTRRVEPRSRFAQVLHWVMGIEKPAKRSIGTRQQYLDVLDEGHGITDVAVAELYRTDPTTANVVAQLNRSRGVETSREGTTAVYRNIWDLSRAGQIRDPALALVHFDAAVNHGWGKAREFLRDAHGDPMRYIDLRQAEYERLVAAGRRDAPGWLADRIPRLRQEVERLMRQRATHR